MLNGGKDMAEVVRHLEVTESTWHRWRQTFGGMRADATKRLKKLLAEAELDKAMLKELAEGEW